MGSPSAKNVTPPPVVLGINPSASLALAETVTVEPVATKLPAEGAVRLTVGAAPTAELTFKLIVVESKVVTPSLAVARASSVWGPPPAVTV